MFTKCVHLYTIKFTSIQKRMHAYISTCIHICNYCLRKMYILYQCLQKSLQLLLNLFFTLDIEFNTIF
jgi:hypothetical protein